MPAPRNVNELEERFASHRFTLNMHPLVRIAIDSAITRFIFKFSDWYNHFGGPLFVVRLPSGYRLKLLLVDRENGGNPILHVRLVNPGDLDRLREEFEFVPV